METRGIIPIPKIVQSSNQFDQYAQMWSLKVMVNHIRWNRFIVFIAASRSYTFQGHGCTSHYNDVIMSAMTSQITGVSIICLIVGSGEDQRKHQSSAPLAFVRGIHRWPVNSPHKGPVTRKMFPFDDIIMIWRHRMTTFWNQLLDNHRD